MCKKPLIIKQIINPFELPIVEAPNSQQIGRLKEWAKVHALAWDSIYPAVQASELTAEWDSVRDHIVLYVEDSVRDSVYASIQASIRENIIYSILDSAQAPAWDWVQSFVREYVLELVLDSVLDSVQRAVWESVHTSVWASVWNVLWAYVSSFFAVEYDQDFSSGIKLWEAGLVPSFDGTTWRLHSGGGAKVVYEWKKE